MQRKRKTIELEKKFAQEIWRLDRGLDRCTGKPLNHDCFSFERLGDVCHLKPRSTHPHLKYSVHNAFLMSRALHIASDGRGNYRLKILGTDARQPLTFRMTDKDGNILWERVG